MASVILEVGDGDRGDAPAGDGDGYRRTFLDVVPAACEALLTQRSRETDLFGASDAKYVLQCLGEASSNEDLAVAMLTTQRAASLDQICEVLRSLNFNN